MNLLNTWRCITCNANWQLIGTAASTKTVFILSSNTVTRCFPQLWLPQICWWTTAEEIIDVTIKVIPVLLIVNSVINTRSRFRWSPCSCWHGCHRNISSDTAIKKWGQIISIIWHYIIVRHVDCQQNIEILFSRKFTNTQKTINNNTKKCGMHSGLYYYYYIAVSVKIKEKY